MQYTDQTGHIIQLAQRPRRIISIVPSQTEMLHYLGLEKEVIGITKFCIHPKEWFQKKDRVGGTKQLNIEKIKRLEPDLILGNKEENTKEQIEELREYFPVWLSDVDSIDRAIDLIDQIGIITNTIPKAQQLIHQIFLAQDDLPKSNKRVLYFIWHEPKMTAGKNTFIDAMLNEAGFKNVLQVPRYPELSEEDIEALSPEYIFLSSEPFPFKEKHRIAYQNRFPNAKVILVDGELFSWYGSRLLHSFDYFRELNEGLLLL